MKTCYILVGVPAAGKSTWTANQQFDWLKTVIVSTDNYIDRVAKEQGKTYSEVFKDEMPRAVDSMVDEVYAAIAAGHDIVWDQTSVSVGTRSKKLRMLPADYRAIAVVFATPEREELKRRLASRPGKNIPEYAMRSMIKNFEVPTVDEGFDEVRFI